MLLHRFKQRSLCLWRSAVDFVCKDYVREYRALNESRDALSSRMILFYYFCAQNIRRHEIGRELNAFETQIHRACNGLDHERLRESRHAFHYRMTADK